MIPLILNKYNKYRGKLMMNQNIVLIQVDALPASKYPSSHGHEFMLKVLILSKGQETQDKDVTAIQKPQV